MSALNPSSRMIPRAEEANPYFVPLNDIALPPVFYASNPLRRGICSATFSAIIVLTAQQKLDTVPLWGGTKQEPAENAIVPCVASPPRNEGLSIQVPIILKSLEKNNNPNPSPIGKRFGLYGFGSMWQNVFVKTAVVKYFSASERFPCMIMPYSLSIVPLQMREDLKIAKDLTFQKT